MNGIELQETVKRSGCRVPFIIVTAYGSVKMAVRAMEAGAITFLEKPCAENVLWAHVLRAFEWSDSLQRRADIRQHIAQLSESERKVLQHIVDGKTNKEISGRLDIGLRTVELRRSTIMKTLGARNLAELIRLVLDSQEERLPLQGPHTRKENAAVHGGTSPHLRTPTN
jgi:two-component system response regulator FixJ